MAMENHEYSELPLVKSRSSARSANFELLRIFAMLLIIAHHLASHGGYGGGERPAFVQSRDYKYIRSRR